MTKTLNRTEIFETMPVKKAVIKQIMPAIAAQMIALVYSLADTYFVGLLGDPNQTAAVTVAFPAFMMITALSNMFGVGGASAISRALGVHDTKRAKAISSISCWFAMLSAAVYAVIFLLLSKPILNVSGATSATYTPAFEYSLWVTVIGGVPTILTTVLSGLVRAEGDAATASIGVSLGGIMNLILDPFFVLPQFLGLRAEGAGIATALSNVFSAVFFLIYIYRKRESTVVRIHPKYLKTTKKHIGTILSVGLPSAIQMTLTVVANAALAKFVSVYPTEAVAAMGISKKIDQLPLYVSLGVANGLMPFLAYNYASGNQQRRRDAFKFGCFIAVAFSTLCLIVYEFLAPQLTGLFIKDALTVEYGAAFLRCMVTAMPLMSFCYLIIIQFQAMERVKEAMICSILRKGMIDIPLLFLMDRLFPLYGCMWVQPIVDAFSLVIALILFRRAEKSTPQLTPKYSQAK